MLFALVGNIYHGQLEPSPLFLPDRGHELVFQALKEDYWRGETISKIDGRALVIEVTSLREGANQVS
jgi:hypothetical protein